MEEGSALPCQGVREAGTPASPGSCGARRPCAAAPGLVGRRAAGAGTGRAPWPGAAAPWPAVHVHARGAAAQGRGGVRLGAHMPPLRCCCCSACRGWGAKTAGVEAKVAGAAHLRGGLLQQRGQRGRWRCGRWRCRRWRCRRRGDVAALGLLGLVLAAHGVRYGRKERAEAERITVREAERITWRMRDARRERGAMPTTRAAPAPARAKRVLLSLGVQSGSSEAPFARARCWPNGGTPAAPVRFEQFFATGALWHGNQQQPTALHVLHAAAALIRAEAKCTRAPSSASVRPGCHPCNHHGRPRTHATREMHARKGQRQTTLPRPSPPAPTPSTAPSRGHRPRW